MEKEEDKKSQLVDAWTRISQQNPGLDLMGFCTQWLLEQQESVSKSMPHGMQQGMSMEAKLAGLCGRLAKYATYYSKRALEPQEIRSVEDWVYLVKLLQMGTPTKSELIVEMASEFPSGIDIIKRLVRQAWIEEYPDEQDRRSKRVRMTAAGQTLLFSTFQRMENVAQVAFQPLTQGEKSLLAHLLQKLDTFHQHTHPQVRHASHEETCTFFSQFLDSPDVNNH